MSFLGGLRNEGVAELSDFLRDAAGWRQREIDRKLKELELLAEEGRKQNTRVHQGLEWQADGEPPRLTFYEAQAYAELLGNGWRLPLVEEIQSAIRAGVFKSSRYYIGDVWSSESMPHGSAWVVQPNGRESGQGKNSTEYVRCVREVA